METFDKRRSDRVHLELRIQLSGVDAAGKIFTEQTHTLVVSRHGAKVVSQQVLLPQQALNIRCYRTGMETLACVVGQIDQRHDEIHYGLEISDPHANIWGIEFPELGEVDPAVGRVLLECQGCHIREVIYLDAFALEVLVANECLMRPCRRCADRRVSMWKRPSLDEDQEPQILPISPPSPAASAGDDRKQMRVGLKTEICLRHPELGDEVTLTDNVSSGGFRFKSKRRYTVGAVMAAALPYTPNTPNVFSPIRIVYAEVLLAEGSFAYGVAYVPAEKPLVAEKARVQDAG